MKAGLVDGLLSEKEQIEAIRSWWQDNGLYIVAGVVLMIALLVGWNYWKNQQEQKAALASALYEDLVSDVADVAVEDAEAKAAEIQASYSDTVYAEQARLAMAKLYMSVGRDQDAADELAALLVGNGDSELRMVARLRLARILLYQEKPEEVIDLLKGYGDTAFAARYAEALGDAYAAVGRFEAARETYAAALAEDPQASTVDVTLVRMKINDLPPPTGAAEEPAEAAAEDQSSAGAVPEDGAAEPSASEPPAEIDE